MGRGRSGLIGAFGALLFAAAPSQAWAQRPPLPPRIAVQLDYVLGPRGEQLCPDRALLRGAFRADFGYDIVQDDAPWRLTVAVNPGPARTIQATMELRDPAGGVKWKDHKRAVNNDCISLISGVALAVWLGIERWVPPIQPKPEPPPRPAQAEPRSAPEPPAPEPAAPEPAAPAPEPAVRAPMPAAPKKDRPAPKTSAPPLNRPRVRAGAGTTFSLGDDPNLAVGLSVQAGVRWPFVSITLEGRGNMPGDEADISTSRIAGLVVPCGHVGMFVGCLVGTLGRQHASNEIEEDSAWYGGIGGRGGIEVPFVGSFAVRLSGEVLGTTPSASVKVGDTERWQTPTVSAVFSAGIVADL